MEDDDKLQSYRIYKKFIERLWMISVLWPPLLTESAVYRTLGFVNVVLLLRCGVLILLFTISHKSQIALFATGVSVFLSCIVNIVKAWCCLINKKELMELKKILDEMFEEAIRDQRTKSIILSNLKQFNYICYTVSMTVIGTGTMFCILPISFVVKEHLKNVENKRYILPMPSKLSFSKESNMLLYAINFSLDCGASLSFALITSVVDGLYGYFIFHIAGQLKVLSYRLQNLEGFGNMGSYKKDLRRYIAKYMVVMRCKNALQIVYGPIVVIVITTTALILCTLVFQAVETEISLPKAIYLTFYTCLKIVQAFAYTWYGSILISQSERFYDSIYFSEWSGNVNKAFVNDFLINLSQKPLKITVCHFLHITVDVFKSILNTSVSYFFLLQTVNSQN